MRQFVFRTLRISLLAAVCTVGGQAAALDRNAFVFTHYDLNARLTPQEHAIEVAGHITLRNDSASAQRFMALQISSTLAWQSITLEGKPVAYLSQPYTTDIDHTGEVAEAIVTLQHAVAPNSTIELQVTYAGTLPADTGRLARIGVPAAIAAQNDWDQVSEAFTAIRGVGYVCWYPVVMEAASLSAGADVFTVLGKWKNRNAAATMHLVLEVQTGKVITANGHLLSQKARSLSGGNVAIQEREYDFSPMGLRPPVFVVGDYSVASKPAITVLSLPGHEDGARQYAAATEAVLPLITAWFGAPRERIVVVDLPAGDTRFDGGTILFAPLSGTDQATIEVDVAHQLTHACIGSPYLWIEEGLAHFAQALEIEQQGGRKAALDYMQQFRAPLAEAEAESRKGAPEPGEKEKTKAGDPLVGTTDEIFFRWKAMFVWWMLRDLVGDEALQRALHQYRASGGEDREADYLERLAAGQSKRPLKWFFDDWVYHDRGLPDLRISAVYATPGLPGNVTVAVTVQNDGDAAAEAPVIIPLDSMGKARGEAVQRLLVPSRGKAAIRITAPDVPAEVIVNDGSVPESDMSNNTFEVK